MIGKEELKLLCINDIENQSFDIIEFSIVLCLRTAIWKIVVLNNNEDMI